MDEATRQRYKLQIAADIKQHRPQDADIAEGIVERLFAMPQLQDESSVLIFIDAYHRAVERRNQID